MLSKVEVERLVQQQPAFDDIMNGLCAGPNISQGLVEETKEVLAIARKFNAEVVRPYALELDKKLHEDPDYLPWDFIKKANEWGFYTMWIPKMFGGKGYNMYSGSIFFEEIGSACLAMANLIGVHYLGVAALGATCNAPLMQEVFRDVAEGERLGEPRILSTAITEPGAGTDVEESDLIDKGNVACHANKMPGGYQLNGSKVFISNGHLCKWHVVIAYSDLEKPSENTMICLVQTGQEGFFFGRHEKKMGQRACPASELIFDACFVPDHYVAIDAEQVKDFKRPSKETFQQLLDMVLSGTRSGVGAFGTAMARAAYEKALDFANETFVDGKLLVNHEWAQCMLAEMYKNTALARLAYMEGSHCNGLYGSGKRFIGRSSFYINKLMPAFMTEKVLPKFLNTQAATRMFRKAAYDDQTDCEINRTSGWGSLAKFGATDLALKNCHMALELMGQAGVRHDRGVEKLLRDAKLLQIYEGTNQLNRLNLFKCLVGGSCPDACVFHDT